MNKFWNYLPIFVLNMNLLSASESETNIGSLSIANKHSLSTVELKNFDEIEQYIGEVKKEAKNIYQNQENKADDNRYLMRFIDKLYEIICLYEGCTFGCKDWNFEFSCYKKLLKLNPALKTCAEKLL